MDTAPNSEGALPPLCPEVVHEPLRPAPRRKTHVFVRVLWTFLLLGAIGSVVLNVVLFLAVGLLAIGAGDAENRVQEQHFALNRHGADKVAILSIEGSILSGEGFFKQQIDHARRDAEAGQLKAIVLRVNSPGGTISGSDSMLHQLRKLAEDVQKKRGTKLPIVVSMGGMAASGGYYVAMCVGDEPDSIFAEPSTWTGSIGVLIPHYNFAELMERWGIQDDTVASHRLKTMGSIAHKMTPEVKKIFQGLIDDSFQQFKEVIRQGRPKFRADPAALDQLATGQIFTARQALANGLVDQIGFVEDAVQRAIRLARLDEANVNVVKYKARPQLADILFGQSRAPASLDAAALLETTSPRAYYLCTWLPALAGSAKE